ncbi:MAG: helix-turn-helix domain-containing protein [Oscillospiraceae bacterium]|jgi:AbrB family looped-hinge helix DNA binding protein|nr:helix-turn-helix domain-containing protein [Oscillospiraceae bacterium]
MNNRKTNIAANLSHLRAKSHMSQEEVAEKIGVTRQAVAKWENGETLPDIINCEAIADLFDVSINDLVRYDSKESGLPIGPRDKYIFGTVTVGERGQIVLPKKARDTLGFKAGDTLVVLGDTNPITAGLALIGEEKFLRFTGGTLNGLLNNERND